MKLKFTQCALYMNPRCQSQISFTECRFRVIKLLSADGTCSIPTINDIFFSADVWATAFLFVMLTLVTVKDLDRFQIPNYLTVPLIIAGLVLAVLDIGAVPTVNLVGAVVGYAIFALIGGYYFHRHGIEGLGLGDAKLAAAAGAWLGWQHLPMFVLIAAVSGLIWAVTVKAKKIAFGPWLSLSFAILWIASRHLNLI